MISRKLVLALVLLVALSSTVTAQTSIRDYNGWHWQAMTSYEQSRFLEGYLLALWTMLKPLELQRFLSTQEERSFLRQAASPLEHLVPDLKELLTSYYRRNDPEIPIWQAIYNITLRSQ